MQAWSSAWTLNGRLLRPAMVVVAKAPTAELPSPATADAARRLSKLDTTRLTPAQAVNGSAGYPGAPPDR